MAADDLKQVLNRLESIERLGQRTHGERVWMWAINVSIPVLWLLASGSAIWASDVNSRLLVIESNRFTSTDAAQLKEQIRSSMPPTWLKEDIQEIKERLKRLEERGK